MVYIEIFSCVCCDIVSYDCSKNVVVVVVKVLIVLVMTVETLIVDVVRG